MPRILIFQNDEYVGHLQDCELLIIPNTTPDEVRNDCHRMTTFRDKLKAQQIPSHEFSLHLDHGEIGQCIIEKIKSLPESAGHEADIERALTAIEQYDSK